MEEQKKSRGGFKILRLYLGIIFLSAGVYRVFHLSRAYSEIASLVGGWQKISLALTIVLEIIFGTFLIFNFKAKKAAEILFIFVALAILFALIRSGKEIFQSFSELFFFNATPTDFFLHLTYLVMLLALIFHLRK